MCSSDLISSSWRRTELKLAVVSLTIQPKSYEFKIGKLTLTPEWQFLQQLQQLPVCGILPCGSQPRHALLHATHEPEGPVLPACTRMKATTKTERKTKMRAGDIALLEKKNLAKTGLEKNRALTAMTKRQIRQD